ncbi:MAG TPA: LpqB family beta-propeller domain-containing protein [Candidatus Baltobacteraceae bacterium]|nr:LpqB family beta-propeller domain-containing protein [Candidatus Baltobacteraceae bacterium]
MMRYVAIGAALLLCGAGGADASPAGFTMAQVLSYPFPDTIVADAQGHAFAYVLDTKGVRTLWYAQAPQYAPRQLFSSNGDDGQELSDVSISRDDSEVVYVRGGDHDANWPEPLQPDPDSSPVQAQMQVWRVATAGGAPKLLGDGDTPAISPDGKQVAFVAHGAMMIVPADGSVAAKRMFFDRGQLSDPRWSPDGSTLAFVSARTDHSFIGIYRNDATPIQYLAPTTSFDGMPRWSLDGSRIAFVRMHGDGGPPQNPLNWNPQPWQIWVADVRSGDARRVYASGDAPRDSLSQFAMLHWMAGDRLVFVSERDNWPHLYAVSANGGSARLLTPGAFQIEDTAVTPDRRALVYSANTGSTPGDDDRRHLFRVDVATGRIAELTAGASSETGPAALSDDAVAFSRATAQQPLLVTLLASGRRRTIDADMLPPDFPSSELVTPQEVSWHAPDGWLIHGQLFLPRGTGRHPAVVFVHGGPPRQMLLTWHYMDYYTNGYAVNQYLVSRGFTVLSINYRLGIGYGHDFQYPAHWGPTGASEYQDVLAGARWLQRNPHVAPDRIGIWGGSYGGYLTALALARNSDVFKAGADYHGVHDWSFDIDNPVWGFTQPKRYQQYDTKKLMRIAWESSPDASIATWRSPVLLIQGDDDRNVEFHQMVDLVERLRRTHVRYEQLVIPNEIHGFLRYASWLRSDTATAQFLETQLMPR